LIVDDDPEMRDYLELALTDRGYRVVTEPAPSAWGGDPVPAIAFIDLVTNGEPAHPLISQLSAQGVPVVLMTGLSPESPVVGACIAAGGSRLLPKPFSLGLLRTLVDELGPL